MTAQVNPASLSYLDALSFSIGLPTIAARGGIRNAVDVDSCLFVLQLGPSCMMQVCHDTAPTGAANVSNPRRNIVDRLDRLRAFG